MWHGPLEERQDELQRAGEAEEEVETGPQARRLRMCPEPEVPSHGVLTVRRGAWYGRLVARNGFLTTGVALLAAGVAAAPGLAGAAPLDVPVVPASVYGTYSKVAGVTATAGWTAWSVGSGATWRLMLRTPSGAITTPPIPARRIPFDASLGVGRGRGSSTSPISAALGTRPTLREAWRSPGTRPAAASSTCAPWPPAPSACCA